MAEDLLEQIKAKADQGYAEAQFNLGVMYAMGEGVPQNDIKAYSLWSVVAAKGDEEARRNLHRLQNRMTSSQIAEAQKQAEILMDKIQK